MIHRALFGSIERFMASSSSTTPVRFPPGSVPSSPRPAGARRPRRLRLQAPRRAEGGGCARLGRFGQRAAGARIRRARHLEKLPYVLVVGDDDVPRPPSGSTGAGSRAPNAASPSPISWRTSSSRWPSGRPHTAERGPSSVSFETIWAGWRNDYVVSATESERTGEDDACVFCRIAASGDPSPTTACVARPSDAGGAQPLPYASGHLLAMPLRHLATSKSSMRPKRRAVGRVRASSVALRARMRLTHQHRANLGGQRGPDPAHLHLHALPDGRATPTS